MCVCVHVCIFWGEFTTHMCDNLQCSAECGRGNRTRSAICLMDHVTDLPLGNCEGERPPEVKFCDSGPCQNQLEWYTGPWGQVLHTYTCMHSETLFKQHWFNALIYVFGLIKCSAECGNGTQTRSVACIYNNNGHMEVVDQSKCSDLPQPITAQTCRLKPCGVQWYVTEWSAVSVPNSQTVLWTPVSDHTEWIRQPSHSPVDVICSWSLKWTCCWCENAIAKSWKW